MAGVIVIPGFMAVQFKENGRPKNVIVPLDADEMRALAGMLLQAAAQTPQPPQPQPQEMRKNGALRASRN